MRKAHGLGAGTAVSPALGLAALVVPLGRHGPLLVWEWWVSENWALGLALEVVAGFGKQDDARFTVGYWDGVAIGLLFSATYN